MSNKTYSKKEIEDDIFQFENVKISLGVNCMANVLYSEHYSEPMDGECTVDELKKRIDEYLQERGTIIH